MIIRKQDKDSPFTGMALSLFLWVVMLRNGTFHCAVGGASIPSLSHYGVVSAFISRCTNLFVDLIQRHVGCAIGKSRLAHLKEGLPAFSSRFRFFFSCSSTLIGMPPTNLVVMS